MKIIQMSHDRKALVDDEDFELVNSYIWSFHKAGHGTTGGYAVAQKNKERIFMHRLINQTPPGLITDHKDGNGLNNQRSNLRSVTYAQNNWNKPRQKNSTSGYKGVGWHKATQKWRVRVCANSDREFVGYFDDKLQAAKTYDIKAKEIFGEYAKLNFDRSTN